MVMQKGKSTLSSKLGNRGRKAHEEVKDIPPDLDTGGLPAGIENGVAQLVECKFGVYEKGDFVGEYFFYAAGIVVSPETHDGAPILGRRTQIGPEPLCDTPNRSRKTIEAHLGWVEDQMKILGVNMSEVEFDDLESTATALKEAGPYFRFRTWKGEKQTTGQYKDVEPRVQHVWQGLCEFSANGEVPSGSVVDETEEEEVQTPPTKAQSVKTPTKPPAKPPTKPVPTVMSPKPKAPEPEFDETVGDLDALLERANNQDEEAVKSIIEIGLNSGIDRETIDTALSWEEVINAIREAGAGGAAEEEAVEDEGAPKVGQCCLYTLLNPKTGKPEKRPVECEIVRVDEDNKVVTLKNLTTGKVVTGKDPKKPLLVSFDDITQMS